MALAAILLVAACGDAAEPAATPAPSTTPPATTATDLPAGCELPPFTAEIRFAGDGPRRDFAVVDAAAVRRLEGRAYTVYLTDYPIDREGSLFSQIGEPPDGSTTVQTGIDVFNAEDAAALPVLAAGTVGAVDWVSGEPATFLNFATAADTDGFSVDQTGQTELLHVDERFVCMRSQITSESGNELVGTYTAEILTDI